MSTEISLEKKVCFILDYLCNNFLISKNKFIKKFNLQEDYFNNKQIQSFHCFQDDYFNVKKNNIHLSYIFFDISFHFQTLDFRICSEIEVNSDQFFVIELPSKEEKLKLIELYQSSYLKYHFLENIIKEKNKIIQILLDSNGNSFSIRKLFNEGLNAVHIEILYEFVKIEKNIKNF